MKTSLSLFDCFWNSKITETDVAILLLDAVSVLVVLKIEIGRAHV